MLDRPCSKEKTEFCFLMETDSIRNWFIEWGFTSLDAIEMLTDGIQLSRLPVRFLQYRARRSKRIHRIVLQTIEPFRKSNIDLQVASFTLPCKACGFQTESSISESRSPSIAELNARTPLNLSISGDYFWFVKRLSRSISAFRSSFLTKILDRKLKLPMKLPTGERSLPCLACCRPVH